MKENMRTYYNFIREYSALDVGWTYASRGSRNKPQSWKKQVDGID